MLEPIYKTKFKKDLKLVAKRGKSIEKLKTVIRHLIEEKPLGSSQLIIYPITFHLAIRFLRFY